MKREERGVGRDIRLMSLLRFAEIIAGIREEEQVTGGVTWREMWLPANRYRLMLAITLQLGRTKSRRHHCADCSRTL